MTLTMYFIVIFAIWLVFGIAIVLHDVHVTYSRKGTLTLKDVIMSFADCFPYGGFLIVIIGYQSVIDISKKYVDIFLNWCDGTVLIRRKNK